MSIVRTKRASKNIENTVHHIPLRNKYEQDRACTSLENILRYRAYRLFKGGYRKDDIVGIKTCINNLQLSDKYIGCVAGILKQLSVTAFVCDTSNRYKDRKTNGVKHCIDALSRQPVYQKMALPYIMLDGILANHEISAKTHGVIPPGVHLAGDLPDMNGLVSICTPVTSSKTGLSGSIVNGGMGLASKRGKILQNSMSPPKVNIEKCYTCRKCVRACPVKAIHIDGEHVAIDGNRCINCGLCVDVAKAGGITYDWNATHEHAQKVAASHALGVQRILRGHIVFINILHNNIKKEFSVPGILVSRNPVAIDEATIDIMFDLGAYNKDECQRARELTLTGEEAGLGSLEYSLNTISY